MDFSFWKTPQFWKDKENQKKFLNEIAPSLHVKKPSDWGKVTKEMLSIRDGAKLLSQYDGSLFKALQCLFPGTC